MWLHVINNVRGKEPKLYVQYVSFQDIVKRTANVHHVCLTCMWDGTKKWYDGQKTSFFFEKTWSETSQYWNSVPMIAGDIQNADTGCQTKHTERLEHALVCICNFESVFSESFWSAIPFLDSPQISDWFQIFKTYQSTSFRAEFSVYRCNSRRKRETRKSSIHRNWVSWPTIFIMLTLLEFIFHIYWAVFYPFNTDKKLEFPLNGWRGKRSIWNQFL